MAFITSISFASTQSERTIDAYNKYAELTPTIEVIYGGIDPIIIDQHRLMFNLLRVESNFGSSNISGRIAKGVTQIEPDTFNAMYSDRRFIERRMEIEERYKVNLKNYEKDEYTNIVSAHAVLEYKVLCNPQWIDIIKIDNKVDVEWLLYKIYYNSIDGKSTYTKWVSGSI